jgi:hypothetical protein
MQTLWTSSEAEPEPTAEPKNEMTDAPAAAAPAEAKTEEK